MFLADTRQKIRNLAILNDEKHSFTEERRSDTKHTSPPAATRATNKVMLFFAQGCGSNYLRLRYET